MAILVMYGEPGPSAGHVERLSRLAAGRRVIDARSEAEAIAAAPHAEIVLGHRYLFQMLPHAGRLRWVQSTASGVDRIMFPQLKARQPLVTRCPIFADVVAWHALALLLALGRRLPETVTAQREGRWQRDLAMLPLPKRALVMGLGEIGSRLAALLRGTGVHVVGCARRRRPEAERACDAFCTMDGWRRHLSDVDAVFLALPLDRTTRGLFDASAVRSLAAHAVLVNVARSGLLDLDAVVERLREGRLGGAAVDVLSPRPLPEAPVWRTPGLLISPLAASFTPDRQRRLEAFVEAQVARYAAGEAPLYAVDHEAMEAHERVDGWGG